MATYNIDTTSGVDSTGNGSSGSPYKSLQYALNDRTQGASGDTFQYVNSTADDVLSATLSLTHYGTPSGSKPLIIQGSGIVGGISGNSGGFTILSSGSAGICLNNLHLHHCGASAILALSHVQTQAVNCELDHSTSGTAVTVGQLIDCLLHDLSGTVGAAVYNAYYNRFDGSASTPSYAMLEAGATAQENEIVLSGSNGCNGIIPTTNTVSFERNSVYGNGGTGKGIWDGGDALSTYIGNVVEGFSGTGGVGFKATGTLGMSAGNRAYNNATNYSYATVIYQGTDYTDTSTNFNSASTGDLSLTSGSGARGNSFPGTYPGSPTQTSRRDAGALQHSDPPAVGFWISG
jgi:hypothetical protein